MKNLKVTDVSKKFGIKSVLDNVSLELTTGTIIGIFGRNGSGKSTLLKIIFGLVKADSGLLEIDGDPISPKQVIPQKSIAYLPQDNFLPLGLKVRDVIPIYYKSGEQQDKIFYTKGIHNIANKKIAALSAGEIRYLQLLLIGNLQHPFLMLDEPFSMIDPIYREHIAAYLIDLKLTKGIIITDHYYHDVLRITDTNFVIKDGIRYAVNDIRDLGEAGYLRK